MQNFSFFIWLFLCRSGRSRWVCGHTMGANRDQIIKTMNERVMPRKERFSAERHCRPHYYSKVPLGARPHVWVEGD